MVVVYVRFKEQGGDAVCSLVSYFSCEEDYRKIVYIILRTRFLSNVKAYYAATYPCVVYISVLCGRIVLCIINHLKCIEKIVLLFYFISWFKIHYGIQVVTI